MTSDRRYKIEQALKNAGLHETEYGRQIMANVKSNKPTRMDNFTTAQLESQKKPIELNVFAST